MLFNSYEFLILYLPLTFLGWIILSRVSRTWGLSWLVVMSLLFYGWWSPKYIWLLLLSITFNFSIGSGIAKVNNSEDDESRKRKLLIIGVSGNLLALMFFKYLDFFIHSLNYIFDLSVQDFSIVLPIGISFYTFTQLAFLVDAYRGEVKDYKPVHYSLFVTYFPHLVAGPILHHKEMIPQFLRSDKFRIDPEEFAIGLTILFIGLFKKVILADGIEVFATPVFDAAAAGHMITFMEGWGGAVSYTLQLYFDFSGYSDMAVGISLLFGVRLPANFDSPYKASSIIDFWRRWHITLSRFLRDYLYIPLGGSRKGVIRRYLNLGITMLLGGLWHGAGWTFIIWGGLHGFYLIVNHGWCTYKQRLCFSKHFPLSGLIAKLITFVAVIVAWVFFRAETFTSALAVLKSMVGLNGVILPGGSMVHHFPFTVFNRLGLQFGDTGQHFQGPEELAWIAGLLIIVWGFPNTYEIFGRFQPALLSYRGQFQRKTMVNWRPNYAWALVTIVLAIWSVLMMSRISSFLYFQF